MKNFAKKTIMAGIAVMLFQLGHAQEVWPLSISASDGTVIEVYQFQPDSLSGNMLKSISAISILKKGSSDPAFGTIWSNARIETDRNNRQVAIESISISAIKIPADTNKVELDYIKSTVESQLPQAAGQIPLDEILATLNQNLDEAKLSNDINTKVREIIFT